MLRFNLKNIVLLFIILILGGCHSGSSSKKLSSLAVSPATSIITIGSTQQYTVQATYSDGTSSTLTSGIKWSSSNTAVATIDAKGLATVVASSGSTNITATYNGVTSAAVTLQATNATVTSITLRPVNSEISHGLTHQYSVQATYSDGTSSPVTSDIAWSSSDTTVATIDANGLATIIAPSGATNIIATHKGGAISAPATLKATSATVTSITLSPVNSRISQGLIHQYAVQATYSNGASSPLTSGIVWSSSDPAVATIDANGLATVIASSGSTNITATYNGIISAPVTLQATNATVTSITLNPVNSEISQGLTQQYAAQATYSNGTSSLLTSGIVWSSSDPAVATIDSDGLATVRASSGSTNITASYNGVASALVTLKATSATVTSITLSPVNSEISQGLTQRYAVQATYTNGASSPLTSGIVWNSSNTTVATIDGDGLATVIESSGTTNITATYNGVISTPVVLKATSAIVSALTLNPLNSEISQGLTQQYTVQATYSNGTTSPLASAIVWNSSDTTVATIDSDGLATVRAPAGSTNIVATYNGITSTPVTLKATSATVTALTLNPVNSEISQGLTQQYTVQATYSNSTSSLLTSGIVWNSSDTTVATIDANGLATVRASLGSTNITATYNGLTSAPVTLKATTATVTAITLSPANSEITEGLTQQYKAVATYSNGISSPLTSGIVWNSSDTTVAIIYSNGLATIRASSGSTNITASYNGVTSAPVTLQAISRTWKLDGSDILIGSSVNLKIALDPLDNLYIAYQGYSINQIVQMKLRGARWKPLGQLVALTPNTNIAFGINRASYAPYLFIVDPYMNNTGVVAKLNSDETWDIVGSHLGAVDVGSKPTLKFSYDGTTYLGTAANNYFAIMMFKDETWQTVGTIWNNTSQYTNFELDSNDIPYITYEENQTRVVKKFVNGAWITVGGTISCPTGAMANLKLDLSDTPYLACTQLDAGKTPNKIRTTILKLEGSSWKKLMPVTSYLYTTVLFNINPINGTPYLTLWTKDTYNISVLKFDGSQWVSSGSIDLPSTNISDINFIFGFKNTPYIAYSDQNNSGKIYVMSYR